MTDTMIILSVMGVLYALLVCYIAEYSYFKGRAKCYEEIEEQWKAYQKGMRDAHNDNVE